MSDAEPFTRLSREVLIENHWHRYCRDRYVQTDGSTGDYYYIDMPGACAIIPLHDDDTVTLIRQQRYLLDTTLWEFPIGGMAIGEAPLDAAKKELREETGLLADTWTDLGAFAPYKGVSNEHTHVFLARDLTETHQDLEPSEGITTHRLPLDEARRRLLEQAVPDGQSLSALMLWCRFRERTPQLDPPDVTPP